MKKFGFISFFGLFYFLLAWQVYGALYIKYPDDPTASIEVQQAYYDDDGDNDQAFSEKHVNYIKVTNSARRYVGVYIERVYPVPSSKVDNGQNDELLPPREEMFSFDTFKYLSSRGYDTEEEAIKFINKTRHYILPIPGNLEPGKDVRFIIKVLGPALYLAPALIVFPFVSHDPYSVELPYDPYSGRDEALLLNKACGYTAFSIFASKLFGVATGEGSRYNGMLQECEDKGILKMPITIIKDVSEFSFSAPKYAILWQQGDADAIREDALKFLAQSDTLTGIDELNNPYFAAADMFEGMLHLGDANWEDVFEVRIIRPRIDELVPSKGEAGSSILIKGVGFYSEDASDEDKKMFTDIYFTTLNNNQMPVTILKAKEFTVVNENEIWVTVPEGFYPGPVQVCVDGLCSNEVNFADDFETSVKITDPKDGDLLSGITILKAEVVDPPADFPEYPATARFFIDGQEIVEKSVQSTQFTFTIDTDPLEDGVHTAKVEMEFPGHIVSDSISFSKGYKALDLSKVNRVRVEFLTKNPYKYTDPSEGDKVTEEGFDERETVRVFSAPGEFEKNRYFAEWYEIGYGNVENGGAISVFFDPTHHIITEISFFRYERDKDPGSSYFLEETFEATSKPADENLLEDANIVYLGKIYGGLGFGSFNENVCKNIDHYSNVQQKNPSVKITEEKGSCIDSSYLRIVLYAD